MRGYYTGYSYCGFLPDGRKMYFANEEDYKEYYKYLLKKNNKGP